MTKQCIDYINQYSSDKSFFLWLNLNPPHPPLHDAPKECLKLYDGVELAWRHNIPDDWRMVEKQVPIGAHCKTAMPFGEQYMQYYAHITAIDNEIGGIFDALESTGLASDTIVVYSSDHGEMLGSHGLLRKGVLYKESAQVPFIIWGHFLQNSCHVTHELMCTIDIYPTLLGIAGIPVPSTAKGVDLSPVIFGEEVGGRKEMMHFDKKLRGIRTEDWLYIMNGRCEELYDRRNDPGELNNLANDKTYKEVLEKMRLQSFEDIICSKFKDITIL